jgi:hypothetical protein
MLSSILARKTGIYRGNHRLRLVLCGVLALVALSACNMPGRRTPAPSGFEMINTAAAKTVAAQLTEISRPPVATAAPTKIASQSTLAMTPTLPGVVQPSPLPSQPPAITVVPQPTQAPQASACDRAKFVKDVTVPDNTIVEPGASFIKTWRLKNVGECTWDRHYALAFVGGELLGAAGEAALQETIDPGGSVDISVNMVAPQSGGTYRSEWKLSNAAGEVFGTGKNADQPVWVQIRVNAPEGSDGEPAVTGIHYDFVSSASSADWYSAAGDEAGVLLAFGGSPDNPNGAAILADQLRLETGQTSGKVLLTVPKLVKDGYVYGIFPSYFVQAGDHFKARIGFAANSDGSCGIGKVIFQIAVKEGENIDTLQEISTVCDGSLTPVDLDLTKLRGRTVEFILAVRANGSPQDDWAVWNSPLITSK